MRPIRLTYPTCYPKVPIPFDFIHFYHFGSLRPVFYSIQHTLLMPMKYVLLEYFDFYSRTFGVIADRSTCFPSLEFATYLLERNVVNVKTAVNSPSQRVNRVKTSMLGNNKPFGSF